MNIQRLLLGSLLNCLISLAAFGQAGSTPVYLKFRADKVYILDEEKVEIVADLYVGTSENPAHKLYAATFNLVFPAAIVLADATSFQYDPQSFLGTSSDVSVLHKMPEALKEGKFNISVSRNDGKSRNGFGKIGEIHFITIHDIIGSRNADETPFNVKAEHIQLLDVNGNELPSETDINGATILIVNDILAQGARLGNARQVAVFPNPTRDQLYIQLRNVQGERLEIFNVAGQRVVMESVQGDQMQINIKDFHPGLYTIKIYTKEGVISRKVLLQ